MSKNTDVAGAKKRFLSGVSVLTLSALAVKVIGLFYKIPLLSYLGTEGMGYFNTAYELYALFCLVCTAGLPTALAVMVSGDGGRYGEKRIYKTARVIFLALGLAGFLVMYLFSSQFASMLDNKGAAACLRAISPTVFFICLGSAYRGYFQGKGNMTPTALSQVVEAACKLLLGLLLGGYAVAQGKPPVTAAAYAIFGLTVGTLLSAVYLRISYAAYTKKHSVEELGGNARRSEIFRGLLAIALPITLSSLVMGGAKFVDLVVIMSRLTHSGYSESAANSLYGCYSTLVLPLFNVLPSLTSSVSLSAIPAISAAISRGKEGEDELRDTSSTAFGLVCAVAIPASIGLCVFSGDILSLLFSSQPSAVAEATPWLSVMAAAVLPSCIITLTAGMLQAAGRAKVALFTMLCGVALKVTLGIILIGKENIGIMGAPLSSVACDALVASLNLLLLSRYCRALIPSGRALTRILLRPTLASAVSIGVVVWMRGNFKIESSSASTAVSILSVMLIYGAVMLIFNMNKQRRTEKYGSQKSKPRGKADIPS